MKPPKPILSPKIYFPGLISIILLPLVSIVYIYFYQARYAMPVSWFDRKGIERLNKLHSQKIEYEKFRKYTNLYLTGNPVHDNEELKKLENLATGLVSNNDIKNGVRSF